MARTQVPSGQILDASITDTDIAAANKDGLAATPSMRTLGTGAAQACAGNDARLTVTDLAAAVPLPTNYFPFHNGTTNKKSLLSSMLAAYASAPPGRLTP